MYAFMLGVCPFCTIQQFVAALYIGSSRYAKWHRIHAASCYIESTLRVYRMAARKREHRLAAPMYLRNKWFGLLFLFYSLFFNVIGHNVRMSMWVFVCVFLSISLGMICIWMANMMRKVLLHDCFYCLRSKRKKKRKRNKWIVVVVAISKMSALHSIQRVRAKTRMILTVYLWRPRIILRGPRSLFPLFRLCETRIYTSMCLPSPNICQNSLFAWKFTEMGPQQ